MADESIFIKINSLGCGWKIFEILGTSDVDTAVEYARRQWHEQFPFGVNATIVSAKQVSERELRKSVEVKGNRDGAR